MVCIFGASFTSSGTKGFPKWSRADRGTFLITPALRRVSRPVRSSRRPGALAVLVQVEFERQRHHFMIARSMLTLSVQEAEREDASASVMRTPQRCDYRFPAGRRASAPPTRQTGARADAGRLNRWSRS